MSVAVDRVAREAIQELKNRIKTIEDELGFDPVEDSPDTDIQENNKCRGCLKEDHLLEVALEAVEHIAQANWNGREQAARMWLRLVFAGKTDKSLDEIQKEINEE